MSFTDYFGDTPRARLLDFLGDHPASDYPITELSEKSGVSRPTIYKELPELERLGMIQKTRTLGNSRLFQLNVENPIVQDILRSDIERSRTETPQASARAED